MAKLNRALNAQKKFYGLKSVGVLFGLIVLFAVSLMISTLVGILASSIGYVIGSMIGDNIHNGTLQKHVYWYLPLRLPNTKSFIPSHKRYFL